MNFNQDDSGETSAHQVVEATVHANPDPEAQARVRLVVLRTPTSPDVFTIELSVTALQSLRLARDLLDAAEQLFARPGRDFAGNQPLQSGSPG